MPTTPTAQKDMVVPKESVYVRVVDWGCGVYHVCCILDISGWDEHTRREITDSHRVRFGVMYTAHPGWGNLKSVFVHPLVHYWWRHSYLINISSSNNIAATTTPIQLLPLSIAGHFCVCICMFVIIFSRLVLLSKLLMISCSLTRMILLSREVRFDRPVPRRPAHSPHPDLCCFYLRTSTPPSRYCFY